ncbi:MAG: hypothetical protein NTZ65_01340 [Candidatus Berkelbacteria bacterium]|nr:hypothetical protein [Candidatus Berkelbacteria bacterium]
MAKEVYFEQDHFAPIDITGRKRGAKMASTTRAEAYYRELLEGRYAYPVDGLLVMIEEIEGRDEIDPNTQGQAMLSALLQNWAFSVAHCACHDLSMDGGKRLLAAAMKVQGSGTLSPHILDCAIVVLGPDLLEALFEARQFPGWMLSRIDLEGMPPYLITTGMIPGDDMVEG